MNYFKDLYNQPPPPLKPNPKGFKMHNKIYRKGSIEESIMFARYNKLNNEPRFLNERRHFPNADLINENGKW